MGHDFGRDVEHDEMIELFERIVGRVLQLQPKAALLKKFGAQPELWLRNEIALELHQWLGGHVQCEADYLGTGMRLDLRIACARQVYLIEVKVEDRNSRDMLSPIKGDAVKIMGYIPEVDTKDKPVVRCLLAVAATTDEGKKLTQAATSEVSNPGRVCRQQGSMTVMIVGLEQRRPPVKGSGPRQWDGTPASINRR
jgi:hypothetical protein